MGGGHHPDVALDAQAARSPAPAFARAVEHGEVELVEMGGALKRHRPAAVVVGFADLISREAEPPQKVEARLRNLVLSDSELLDAELHAEHFRIESEPDIERRSDRRLDRRDFGIAEAGLAQGFMVDVRAISQRPVAGRVADDILDFAVRVSKLRKRVRNRLVDDLEVAPARQLLELDDGVVRLDPGGVAVHHQPNRARRRDQRGLGIPVAVLLTEFQGLVPSLRREFGEGFVRASLGVERNRRDVDRFVAVGPPVSGIPVVPDDPEHLLGVLLVAREWPQLLGHLRGRLVGHASHQRRDRRADGSPAIGIVSEPHVHQQAAEIGVA